MSFLFIQFLNGLSHATTLFLMAAGLTLIFGVTRIVNFAHGGFFMLGALLSAHWVTNWFPAWGESAALYALAMLIGAAAAALAGGLAERLLLRRLYAVPELYQLVATFGLTLAMHDLMRWGFGPDEVFAPRFPGLKGSVSIGGEFFPVWQLVTLLLGPVVWLGLQGLLHRTRFGRRLRAATQDRAMLDALGVDPRPLMLAAVMLGCGLAGLGGALQLPREPANLQMDMNVIVETFVVVVTGGLGSITGALLAAMLIGLIHSFGLSLFPQATLVLVFLTMALVLALRPQGLLGQAQEGAPREAAQRFVLPSADSPLARFGPHALMVLAALSAAAAGPYWQALACDALILMVFGISLQAMMALGGLVSFGHAAFFALGAYGAALAHLHAGTGLLASLLVAALSAALVAALFGVAVVRSAGVYLAMLSLALAQVVWAVATQWVGLTGGDNGLIGLSWFGDEQRLLWLGGLLLWALLCFAGLQRLARSGLGAALQAARDAPERAAASGLAVGAIRYQVFVASAAFAGLAGGLFVAHKGSVFPSVAQVATSVDVLLAVLLGGVHQAWGVAVGGALLTWAGAELARGFEYWRGALGVLVMLIMAFAPSGLLGWRRAVAGGRA